MVNKKIFITGGAGYLGRNLIKRYYNDNDITVFSRDEAKHYYLKKDFPKMKVGKLHGKMKQEEKLSYSNLFS